MDDARRSPDRIREVPQPARDSVRMAPNGSCVGSTRRLATGQAMRFVRAAVGRLEAEARLVGLGR